MSASPVIDPAPPGRSPDIIDHLKSSEQLMTARELASILAISPKTVYSYAERNMIPHFKIEASVRFRGRDVAEWLYNHAILGRGKSVRGGVRGSHFGGQADTMPPMVSGGDRVLSESTRNYLNRVLKPATIRAHVGVYTRRTPKGEEVESTDVNFQVFRRTCATLFGAKAKDPRDTQAQLRHADPSVTLRHYQKSIPASVKTAALAFESELMRIPVKWGTDSV